MSRKKSVEFILWPKNVTSNLPDVRNCIGYRLKQGGWYSIAYDFVATVKGLVFRVWEFHVLKPLKCRRFPITEPSGSSLVLEPPDVMGMLDQFGTCWMKRHMPRICNNGLRLIVPASPSVPGQVVPVEIKIIKFSFWPFWHMSDSLPNCLFQNSFL